MTVHQLAQPAVEQEVIEETDIVFPTQDDSSFDDQTSSSSENSSHLQSASIPILVGIESPLLSAIFVMLNSTDCFRDLFSNSGKDIVHNISYDPEWWRHMQDSHSRPEKSESDWRNSVRIEFQILSAFLSGKMDRSIASSANLESLFRMKKDRSIETQLEVTTIFKILSELPEVSELITVYARIDGEISSILPIPVNVDHNATLAEALDETFWGDNLDFDEFDIDSLPVLESIPDVLIVNPLHQGIELELRIWPEKYSKESSAHIQKKLNNLKELKVKQEQYTTKIEEISSVNGKSVLDSLELAAEALHESCHYNAAEELLEKKKLLHEEINKLKKMISDLDTEFNHVNETLLEVADYSAMTPYRLKAVLWVYTDGNVPLLVFKSDKPGMWNYVRKAEHFEISWDDVKAFTGNSDNYLAFYEKDEEAQGSSESPDSFVSTDLRPPKQIQLAPSVREFVAHDNKCFTETANSHKETDTTNADEGMS